VGERNDYSATGWNSPRMTALWIWEYEGPQDYWHCHSGIVTPPEDIIPYWDKGGLKRYRVWRD
jgi:hypothetical protein